MFIISLLLSLVAPIMWAEEVLPLVIPVRIATFANFYPYTYPCENDPTQPCGIEIDLFTKICKDEVFVTKRWDSDKKLYVDVPTKLDCQWIMKGQSDWAPAGNPLQPGGLLYNLTHAGPNGFEFDAVINSLSTTTERRLELQYSIPYYTALHTFIGRESLAGKIEFDEKRKFPKDQQIDGRKLRISAGLGFLKDELKRAYGEATNIEVVNTPTPEADLVAGKIDIFFAWNGLEKMIQDKFDGGKKNFIILGQTDALSPDVRNAVGVATRQTPQGHLISELFSQGILKSRADRGTPGGYYLEIFKKYLGYDLWPCQSAPYVMNDPKCPHPPK